jgi:hypothetical protein
MVPECPGARRRIKPLCTSRRTAQLGDVMVRLIDGRLISKHGDNHVDNNVVDL